MERFCLNTLLEADQAFNPLPAAIRKKFGNDPKQFLEFVHDEKNLPEMAEMGLTEEQPVQLELEDAIDSTLPDSESSASDPS